MAEADESLLRHFIHALRQRGALIQTLGSRPPTTSALLVLFDDVPSRLRFVLEGQREVPPPKGPRQALEMCVARLRADTGQARSHTLVYDNPRAHAQPWLRSRATDAAKALANSAGDPFLRADHESWPRWAAGHPDWVMDCILPRCTLLRAIRQRWTGTDEDPMEVDIPAEHKLNSRVHFFRLGASSPACENLVLRSLYCDVHRADPPDALVHILRDILSQIKDGEDRVYWIRSDRADALLVALLVLQHWFEKTGGALPGGAIILDMRGQWRAPIVSVYHTVRQATLLRVADREYPLLPLLLTLYASHWVAPSFPDVGLVPLERLLQKTLQVAGLVPGLPSAIAYYFPASNLPEPFRERSVAHVSMGSLVALQGATGKLEVNTLELSVLLVTPDVEEEGEEETLFVNDPWLDILAGESVADPQRIASLLEHALAYQHTIMNGTPREGTVATSVPEMAVNAYGLSQSFQAWRE